MPTEHKLGISTQTTQANSLEAEGRKAGMSRRKGWFQRILVGMVPQRGHPGKFVLVEKFMKRVGLGDWYSEKVRDQKTGELLHQCFRILFVQLAVMLSRPALPHQNRRTR